MANREMPLIERYLAGPATLRTAVRDLSDAQLDALPIPGTWSIRTIVAHLLHAELFLVARVLQITAEETPLVMNWEENAFVARLHYDRVPADVAIFAIEALRITTGATLRALDDAAFDRVGIHSKAGKVTMREQVDKACWHLDHHLTFVATKRAMVAR